MKNSSFRGVRIGNGFNAFGTKTFSADANGGFVFRTSLKSSTDLFRSPRNGTSYPRFGSTTMYGRRVLLFRRGDPKNGIRTRTAFSRTGNGRVKSRLLLGRVHFTRVRETIFADRFRIHRKGMSDGDTSGMRPENGFVKNIHQTETTSPLDIRRPRRIFTSSRIGSSRRLGRVSRQRLKTVITVRSYGFAKSRPGWISCLGFFDPETSAERNVHDILRASILLRPLSLCLNGFVELSSRASSRINGKRNRRVKITNTIDYLTC